MGFQARRIGMAAAGAALAACGGVALGNAHAVSQRATQGNEPWQGGLASMAYGFMIDGSQNAGNLRYIGPAPIQAEVKALEDQEGKPALVRIGQPLNAVMAHGKRVLENGNPGGLVRPWLTNLKSHGIRIGASLSTTTQSNNPQPRDVAELVKQARMIRRQTDGAGRPLYSFLFLDHTGQWTGARETHALQVFVKKLYSTDHWTRVMTNDTPFHPGNPNANNEPPKHGWAHAHQLKLLAGKHWKAKVRAAATTKDPNDALMRPDLAFIRWVHSHDPGSWAVMKLEVASESEKFAQLPLKSQCTLLTDWSALQAKYGFRFIYPLFAPGHPPYNSLSEGPQPGANCTHLPQGNQHIGVGLNSTNTHHAQAILIGKHG